MARTGRPPKPAVQKALLGNPGKRPVPKSPLALVPVIEPELVERSPADLIDTVLDLGQKWFKQTDAVALAMLREAVEERDEVRRAIVAGHGKRSDLRALDRQIMAQLSSCCFDPASRERLGWGDSDGDASPIAAIKAQRTG